MGCFGDVGDFVSDTVGGLFGIGGDVPSAVTNTAASNPYTNILAQIAQGQYTRNKPLMNAVNRNLMEFMGYKLFDGKWKRRGTPFNVTTLPAYKSGKRSIAESFAGAKDSILSMLPAGGTLMDALANARIGSAETLSDFGSNLAMDMYNKAYGQATGAPGQAMTGLSGAASSYAQGMNTGLGVQSQSNDMLGSLGSGIGDIISEIPWGSVGSSIGSAMSSIGSFMFSTKRLKRNIKFAATIRLKNGRTLPMVTYNYLWDAGDNPRVGVLAEDLYRVFPEAVALGDDNLPLMVHYGKLGAEIEGVL